MIINAGGLKIQVINCEGCPSNASLLNPDCSKCIKKSNGTIFDKGYFIKFVMNINKDWIDIKEKIFPGFCSFVTFNPQGKVEKRYNIENNQIQIINGDEIFYSIKFKEEDLTKDEIDQLYDGIEELRNKNINGTIEDCEKIISDKKLSKILYSYTYGFDFLESLLKDDNIQDIYINPNDFLVYINHRNYGNIKTNIILLPKELHRLASKFRLESKRPFDEAMPILHMNINKLNIRVAGIRDPLTFNGMGFAIRKHNPEPWTIPMFVNEKMFNEEVGAILHLLITLGTNILITGSRGSGKTSLLGALLSYIPKNERMIVIEDTDELPIKNLQENGYNISHLRIRATTEGYEMKASDALRTALRLGESILVMGEVRGEEARYLFEAMRVGAVGNTVLGTIHGSTPYDVWDRIVNDLNVPNTSFKASDFIISLEQVNVGESTKRKRKLTKISYVDKKWKDEPKFIDVVEYENKKWKIKNLNPIKEIANKKKINLSKSIRFRKELIKFLIKRDKIKYSDVINATNKIVRISNEMKKFDYKVLMEKYKRLID